MIVGHEKLEGKFTEAGQGSMLHVVGHHHNVEERGGIVLLPQARHTAHDDGILGIGRKDHEEAVLPLRLRCNLPTAAQGEEGKEDGIGHRKGDGQEEEEVEDIQGQFHERSGLRFVSGKSLIILS